MKRWMPIGGEYNLLTTMCNILFNDLRGGNNILVLITEVKCDCITPDMIMSAKIGSAHYPVHEIVYKHIPEALIHQGKQIDFNQLYAAPSAVNYLYQIFNQ